MAPEEVKNRVKKLRMTVERHNHLYYVLDTQEISDTAYDYLEKELVKYQHIKIGMMQQLLTGSIRLKWKKD